MDNPILKTALAGGAAIVALLAAGFVMPKWLLFLSTMAISHGLVSMGIVLLMRSGVVSFGQGFVFAAGGYAAALLANHTGITDAVVLVLGGGLAAALLAAPFSPLLSRYRGIFFAMLTLAISMVLYGILVKSEAMGGSDGFNVSRPTLFGNEISSEGANLALYSVAVVLVGLLATVARVYSDSVRGMVSLAIRENELRIEYLGASVSGAIAVNFVFAAFLGGVGGALTVLALGHIEPNFSYWTTSGEFVFVAILSGHHSMLAVFLASFVVEVVRSFSNLYFPNTWQLAMGLFLLVVIRFLPRGLGSLWIDRQVARRAEQEARA
ncbi:branched-chain amino acid ABC transporter permease [Zeimonas arvi]|uniref:Branched-chain amino acid ABC transporter permease n=1 Tax=Zeimonas arvi TaxID=2498847 RepID=A0A5C8P3P0_9BURK|nr:branched-chain amino acid ABC transporter permease [Zeimonas arvi]TXL68276.1 branched-chain amino acid ABC transporter permease [Zeimonas arvi]